MQRRDLIDHISGRSRESARPVVVGVSGYCGSGKSTLARELVAALPGAVRIRGDDFLDPARSHLRSTDWDGVDRSRLVASVIEPFREQRLSEFRRYDWSARALGDPEPLPLADVLVVDLIGLFHPDVLPLLDAAGWCDVDLDTDAARGMDRDRKLGRTHESLWRDVWIPNEIDFRNRFDPRLSATVLYESLGER